MSIGLIIIYVKFVVRVGLEPTRSYEQRILSPLRLPLRHRTSNHISYTKLKNSFLMSSGN